MPEYPIPPRFAKKRHLPLKGELRLIHVGPPLKYLWDDTIEIEIDWEAGVIRISADPPPKFLNRLQQMGQRTPKENEWKRTLENAQGAVGKSLDQITIPERRALVDLLLMKSKAVGPDGTIKPLREWLGFRAGFDDG